MVAAGGLDLTQLCIVEGKKVWMVGIDSIVLASDGSEVDALSIAIKVSALRITCLSPFSG